MECDIVLGGSLAQLGKQSWNVREGEGRGRLKLSLANKVGMLAKNYGLGRCVQRRGLKGWAGFQTWITQEDMRCG
jgi:hypothetical protein